MLLLSLKFKSLINWQILQSGKSLAHLIILEKLINIFERCSESVFSFLYSFIMEAYDDMKEHSFLSFHKYLHVKYINGAAPILFIEKRRNLLSFHHTLTLVLWHCYPILNDSYQ